MTCQNRILIMREIFKLYPVGKSYMWGGERLKNEFGKLLDISPLAESWECSTHPDGVSWAMFMDGTVVPLLDLLKENPHYLGSRCRTSSELPIIIKYIDANENLSVQVHPDDEYAMKYEAQNGKNEFWYIVDTTEEAEIVFGFEHLVTPQQLREAIHEGDIEKHLHKVHPKCGDYFFVKAGTVHAIGRGNLIVEVQQTSNLTYRLYDYNRRDLNGKKRELQIEKALDVLDYDVEIERIEKPKYVRYHNGFSEELLCDCAFFKVNKIVVTREFRFQVKNNSFTVFVCIHGMVNIADEENKHLMKLRKGESVFVPADGAGELSFIGQAELLEVFI